MNTNDTIDTNNPITDINCNAVPRTPTISCALSATLVAVLSKYNFAIIFNT